jgi:hypothetical protein
MADAMPATNLTLSANIKAGNMNCGARQLQQVGHARWTSRVISVSCAGYSPGTKPVLIEVGSKE